MEDTPWQLLGHLTSDIPDQDDFLCSDFTPKQAARIWLKKSLIKKFEPKHDDGVRSAKAVALWKQMNARCVDSFVSPEGTDYLDDTLYLARDLMYRQLNTDLGSVLSLDAFHFYGCNGPGASTNRAGTDYFTKSFLSAHTVKCESLYKHYASKLQDRWEAAEMRRTTLYPMLCYTPAEMFCVRKSSEIDRVALKEASLNMFYQLGASEVFKKVLRKHHRIDMSRQPHLNGYLAKLGSMDGKYCTIDLKSASDTIATRLVAWLVDRINLAPLNLIRSDQVVDAEGKLETIHMYSSMGNGFNSTFQTLIFATLVKACYIELGLPFWDPIAQLPTYSVFGDDIICVKEAYARVVAVLERCGFIVNSAKSYSEGPFRESCGKDYFKGHNIRGVYIRKIQHESHVYSAFNRLVRWSVRNDVPIPRVLRYLKRQAEFRPVPFDEGDTSGFQWPSCLLTNRKVDPDTGGYFYRSLQPGKSERQVRATLNPNGAIICAIGDRLRDGYVHANGHERKRAYFAALRQDGETYAYQVVRKSSSSWDWIPHAGVNLRDYVHTVIALD